MNSLSSGNLLADRRFEWARDCERKGDTAAAADLLVQAAELAPAFVAAWFMLGELRMKLNDRAGAIEAFQHAHAADPSDRHGAALHLTKLGARDAGAIPQAYVRALFDDYAARFDRTLTDSLEYCAPALLRDAVCAVQTGRFGATLDLGCGTGLAGAAFRPQVDWLAGVDVSSAMLAKARAKGVYDRLVEADIAAHLAAEAAAKASYHLIVAADVFVYLHDLGPVIGAAKTVLARGGLLAFSCETHDSQSGGQEPLLRETLRYAHSPAAVSDAVRAAGLTLLRLDSAVTRTEKGEPVPGLVCVAIAPA